MAQPTQQQINDALVAIVAAAQPQSRVWNRIRIATTNEEFVEMYARNGVGNVWFIRRTQINDETSSFDDILSETHVYELRHARSLIDADESDGTQAASERLFQADIESVRAAVNADKHLGLGGGTSHNGFQIVDVIPTAAQLGAFEMHMCVGRLEVTISDC